MSLWISVFSGILLLLLTAIGGLVLARMVFMSKQIAENHKESANAIQTVWDDIKEERRRCSEMHLTIARDIGGLQERTTNLRDALESMKIDMLAKYDRTSTFWNQKADTIDRSIAVLQSNIMDYLAKRQG